ncbi:MAG: TonB-dependent receptor, partial [Deltaproteobacteria bacterium]
MKNHSLLSVVAVLILFISLSFAYAEDDVNNLGTITVTAPKIEENLEDVPIAVSVFDDVSLEDKSIVDLKDISFFVPNFYLFSGADTGMNSSSMRGISANLTTASSTMDLYIDGVPITNNIGFESVLEHIERIEILQGPQGTLYGKNAQVGVINVISKKPANELEGKVVVEYGKDNKQQLVASVNTPVVQ